jgi:hypothetical protein
MPRDEAQYLWKSPIQNGIKALILLINSSKKHLIGADELIFLETMINTIIFDFGSVFIS